ncbi:hypothetical protein Busp01_36060 [Trinickia caryophylli]|nr:hypothetical protein Busp01_36060 [Trinickia caryophylli]
MLDPVRLEDLLGLPVIELQPHAAHLGLLQELEIFVRAPVARALDEPAHAFGLLIVARRIGAGQVPSRVWVGHGRRAGCIESIVDPFPAPGLIGVKAPARKRAMLSRPVPLDGRARPDDRE